MQEERVTLIKSFYIVHDSKYMKLYNAYYFVIVSFATCVESSSFQDTRMLVKVEEILGNLTTV